MTMALRIGPEERIAAARVLAYSEAHPYRPFDPQANDPIPGGVPEHVLVIPHGIRCVFSYTVDRDGSIWRHLSVSLPGHAGRYPNPRSMEIIGHLFGFSGPLSHWAVNIIKDEEVVVVAQRVQALN
jgi:hypothetical protein